MADIVHGTRAHYRGGCRCTCCRAANAAYISHYRRRRAAGRPLLGSRIPAHRTHILMRALRAEMARGQLDGRLGWGGHYARIQRSPTITLRTALKVLREFRRASDGGVMEALPGTQAAVALEILNGLGKN
jgi:hypothetical protein